MRFADLSSLFMLGHWSVVLLVKVSFFFSWNCTSKVHLSDRLYSSFLSFAHTSQLIFRTKEKEEELKKEIFADFHDDFALNVYPDLVFYMCYCYSFGRVAGAIVFD